MSGSDTKKRILIVDDESVIADSLAMIFSHEGYEARSVYSAEQALQLLTEWVADLAIIDVRLPGMNGVDLAILLKVKYPDCKVSLFAGQAATTDFLAPAREGGHSLDIVEKPIHPTALLLLAARLLGSSDGEAIEDSAAP